MMFPKMTRIVTTQPNGIRTWRDHVNKVFAKFHGNELGARKADAFAAQLLNLKNANTLFGLEGKDAFDVAVETLEALCTRSDDNNFGDGYYDFFVPVLEVSWTPDGDDNPTDQGPICLGVFTTICCDDEDRRLEFRQSLKLSIPTVFGGCDYHDASFWEWRLLASGDKNPLVINGFSEQGRSYLAATDDALIKERVDHMETLKAAGQIRNHAVYIDVLRCVQTLEMDRVVDALGENPRMSFVDAGSGNSLYEGFIAY
jgi:hypothetical protein